MRIVKFVVKYTGLLLISLLSLIPFYVLFFLSVTDPSVSFADKVFLIPQFYFQNYIDAWKTSKIGLAILNSLIITGGTVIVVAALASMAGYTIARFRSRFNAAVLNILLVCMMIPGIINTVPLYTLMRQINGINTRWAMILVCATNALPFAVFLYTNFIMSLPKEIEESALIDGCNYFTAYFRVTFPLLKPVTSAVVIITGQAVWNNYGQAVFFLQEQSVRTVPIAVSMFFQQYGAKWNLMAAASVIGVLPIVITFLIFQKYFIKGIAAGSLKG